jgi:hypothetical protein
MARTIRPTIDLVSAAEEAISHLELQVRIKPFGPIHRMQFRANLAVWIVCTVVRLANWIAPFDIQVYDERGADAKG